MDCTYCTDRISVDIVYLGPEPEPPAVLIRMECCGQWDERDPFMHVCVVRG